MHLARIQALVFASLAGAQLAKRHTLHAPSEAVAVVAGLTLRKDRTRPVRLLVPQRGVVRSQAAAAVSDAERAVAPHEKSHTHPALVGASRDSSIHWKGADVG